MIWSVLIDLKKLIFSPPDIIPSFDPKALMFWLKVVQCWTWSFVFSIFWFSFLLNQDFSEFESEIQVQCTQLSQIENSSWTSSLTLKSNIFNAENFLLQNCKHKESAKISWSIKIRIFVSHHFNIRTIDEFKDELLMWHYFGLLNLWKHFLSY